MAYDYTFKGTLQFPTPELLTSNLEQLKEQLEDEDENVQELAAEEWENWFSIDEEDTVTLNVIIEAHGPGDWWFVLEGLIESLVEEAEDGHIDAHHESGDTTTRYHAGGETSELDEEELEDDEDE
ncbi:MAG: hypothetical protein ACE366_12075 [Bradymonadia bacterium]